MFNIFCAICIFIAIYIFIASGKFFKSFAFTAFYGLCGLAAIYYAQSVGVPIVAITPISIGAGIFLGLPGIIGFLILKLIAIF